MIQDTRLPTLEPSYHSNWSLDDVRVALDEHEAGNFALSAVMAEMMMRDERIASAMHVRVMGVAGQPYALKGEDASLKLFDAHKSTMLPPGALDTLLHTQVLLGVAVAYVPIATLDSDAWVPSLQPVPMQYVRRDSSKGTYVVQTRTGPVEVDETWYIGGKRPYGYLDGVVRSLAIPWLIRDFALRDWARYSEKHGAPIVVAEIPESLKGREKEDFKASMRRMGRDMMVFAPVLSTGDKVTLNLLEAQDGSWQGFDQLIAQCDTSIAIRILGQNLTTEVQGGSYAAASVHDSVRTDIKEADALSLSSAVSRAILVPFAEQNGIGPVSLCWDFTPYPTLTETSDMWVKLGAAVAGLTAAGFALDLKQVAQKFELPVTGAPAALARLADAPQDAINNSKSELSKAEFDDLVDQVRTQARTHTYMDALENEVAGKLEPILGQAGDTIIALANEAPGFDALKEALLEQFADLTSDEFTEIMTETLVLGALRGMLDGQKASQLTACTSRKITSRCQISQRGCEATSSE